MSKVVIGIVENKDAFLMARRRFSEGNLSWTFPGGAIEEGETEQDAVVREIFEEIDIHVKPLKILGERVHPATKKEICYMLCEYVSGEIKVKDSEELDKVEWMTADEIFQAVTSDLFQPVKDYLLSTNL